MKPEKKESVWVVLYYEDHAWKVLSLNTITAFYSEERATKVADLTRDLYRYDQTRVVEIPPLVENTKLEKVK